jgi:perosamine synthetase
MKIQTLSSYIRRKDMDSVLNCMVTDQLDSGEYYDRFLKLAKEKLRFDYALALRSPALALALAFKCLDMPAGSPVALSALSDPWVLDTITAAGYTPFWMDVDAGTGCLSQAAIESLAGSGARALYLAHPWGVLIDPGLLQDVGIPIIEDISTSLGAWIDGASSELADDEPVPAVSIDTQAETGAMNDEPAAMAAVIPPSWQSAGSWGTFVILGLEHAHTITAGGGALLFANNRRDAQVLRNVSENLPLVSRLGDMGSALAMSQLKDADKFLEKRAELFKLYEQSLIRAHRKCLMQAKDGRPAYYGCVVVLDSGIKDVRAYAKKKEVDTALAFETSCAGRGLVPEGLCPIAASLANRAVAFPLHPRLGKTAAQKVAKVLATLP